jgi:hypothetical protein
VRRLADRALKRRRCRQALIPARPSRLAGLDTPIYLATLAGLAASGTNYTLLIPSQQPEAPTRFLLDTNGSASAGCSAVVYLKSMDAGYCRLGDSAPNVVVANISSAQALWCNATLATATAFMYRDNVLSFMSLRLSAAANGAVVFAGENETVTPVVPVPAGGPHMRPHSSRAPGCS